jgi:trehalose-6-phosphatase
VKAAFLQERKTRQWTIKHPDVNITKGKDLIEISKIRETVNKKFLNILKWREKYLKMLVN